MACFASLPLELARLVFKYLNLCSLISARGVCTWWRDNVLSADINPIRRDLLKLYLQLVHCRNFTASRHRVHSVLKPFDREAYISALSSQVSDSLPSALETWILEWPAGAAFDCIWPGLPHDWDEGDIAIRRHGWNMLANLAP